MWTPLPARPTPPSTPPPASRWPQIAACEAADVDAAVKAARRSFEQGVWAKRSPAERKQVLLRFADLIEENLGELALLDCLDAGKPITDCLTMDLPDSVHCFRWHAEAIDKEYERVAPTGPANVAMIVREPLGVIGAILPWNFPFQMAAWKLGPILATGNSVVVKPARQTSLSVLRLAEIAAEAGIPEGVLNVVPGGGSVIGAALCKHPGRGRRGLHRLDRSGPPAAAILRRVEPQARRSGTRRQEPAGRFRGRRRPRLHRPPGAELRLLEHGRELQLRLAPDRPSQAQEPSCWPG